MDAVVSALRFVNLIAAALLAGGQTFCMIAVLPAMPGWAPAMSARVHADALTDRPHRFLRVAGAVSLVTALALCATLALGRGGVPLLLTAAGLVATAVSSFVSTREWPINEEIKSWGQEPKLERYAELRRLWDVRHVRRTWLSLTALACFALAAAVA